MHNPTCCYLLLKKFLGVTGFVPRPDLALMHTPKDSSTCLLSVYTLFFFLSACVHTCASSVLKSGTSPFNPTAERDSFTHAGADQHACAGQVQRQTAALGAEAILVCGGNLFPLTSSLPVTWSCTIASPSLHYRCLDDGAAAFQNLPPKAESRRSDLAMLSF